MNTNKQTTTNNRQQPEMCANLRLAFAIVGALIGAGALSIDMASDDWHSDLEVAVEAAHGALEEFNA